MIKTIIKELANDKAPGPDNICTEAIQAGGKAAAAMTHKLIKHIWETKQVPEDLGRATIVLLPKDAKQPKHPELQRPISLTNTWYKILDKILAQKLASHIENTGYLAEPQYGLRKNRSTADHMITLELLSQI